MSASGGIPPYGERDHEAAQRAVELWRDRPIRSRVGTHELSDLVREVAGAIATARAEGAVRVLKLVTRVVERAPWGVGDPLTIRDELLRALAPDAEVPR